MGNALSHYYPYKLGHYNLHLNNDTTETDDNTMWNDSAPTSTHFNIGSNADVNADGTHTRFVAMLFSSVDGISKVGSYTGDGNGARWINVGFQPRFLLLKKTDNTGDWLLVDSARGVEKNMYLNTDAASSGGQKIGTSSTSFSIMDTATFNANGDNYIYYAHA